MGAAQYDGRPSPQLAARLDHVVELWGQGFAPMVITTGGNRAGDRFTEAESSANYLIDRGVPADAIVQVLGTNSYESLREVITAGVDVPALILIAPYLGMPRALRLAAAVHWTWERLVGEVNSRDPRSIRDAVHSDLKLSQSIYEHVDAVAQRLGADPKDQVPFEKYAKAAESLLKPSSAARAVASGAPFIERVDLLVKLISHQIGMPNAEIDRAVEMVDQKMGIVQG